jgi:hypothetical protein
MDKYKVNLPNPSAKRLKDKEIVITFSDGWSGDMTKQYSLNENENCFVFEVDEKYYPIQTNPFIDGPTFVIEVIFTNDAKTRKETIELLPNKLI